MDTSDYFDDVILPGRWEIANRTKFATRGLIGPTTVTDVMYFL